MNTTLNFVRFQDEQRCVEALTGKWTAVIQDAITDLWDGMPHAPPATLTSFIDHLMLDHKLIGYLSDEETFISWILSSIIFIAKC